MEQGLSMARCGHAGALSAALCLLLLAACGRDDEAAPRVAGGDAARGIGLMAQYQCGACHAIPGVQAAGGDSGPSLDRFGRRSYIAGRLPNMPDRLVAWIVDPPALVPGTRMPVMGVSENDARHIAAALYTLR
ncbi:cytochrome c [Noviherbaspirillum sp. L7-7A]|uniref:c-type cytochrome n=1 Tax=Noviherbaspirillum sp. L7-7A TaxID=2850560 RepID=UPI002012B38B|nr:cytochrome c [Noviherbaspirillum sp. L7-7A]